MRKLLSGIGGMIIISSLIGQSCTISSRETDAKEEPMTTEDSISLALDYQLTRYPVSQYRDIYKNFMQDFFGPGHIIADMIAPKRYLIQELSEPGPFDGPLYEPTGYQGNFCRVNLSVVRDSIVPFHTYFRAFVESVQDIVPPEPSDWKRTWSMIDSVITSKGLHFEDEDKDRESLERQFDEGNYIVHHSQRFNDSVHFHYRIISRDKFNSVILPLIEARSLEKAVPND